MPSRHFRCNYDSCKNKVEKANKKLFDSEAFTAKRTEANILTFRTRFSFQIKDVTRQIKKAVVASNLQELQKKSSEKFGKAEAPQIHLDSDGTEIDDEDYFQTLEPNTELVIKADCQLGKLWSIYFFLLQIAVFSGEQWIDVSLMNDLGNRFPIGVAHLGLFDVCISRKRLRMHSKYFAQ